MNIIIFEDKNMGFLNPFAINHSAIELRIGAITNFDRIKLIYPSANFILVVSPHLKKIIKERFPDYEVNPEIIPKGICLNARSIFKKEHVNLINKEEALSNNAQLI